MADEEVIRRRLLIDGDGTGDDRRLNLLLKSILKYCNSPDDTPEEKQVNVDRMLLQLTQCEHAFEKSRLQLVMSTVSLRTIVLAKHETQPEARERRMSVLSMCNH
ncbi:THO complex subunit 7 homolog [Diaphorina citri]|uniref:THO complex subunit 7 homolog n=1 Tax=Diaphorina citri TaxID=121845 RepID=A0A1S3DTA2_DIACI|nr:THO complex subunit 7 homolog [Diaphorina citri]